MRVISLRHVLAATVFSATALAASVATAVALPAPAFSDLVIFGDSLSDTGNTQALLAGFGVAAPNPADGPYAGGRYSNGPLWTEYLAIGLGQTGDANPYFMGGNNYAFAGARTGGLPGAASPIPSVLYQTQTIWGSTHATADANALYVVVAGGNDMRDARTDAPGNSAIELKYRQLSAEAAIANLQSSLGVLAQRGAKNVLVSNLPDLGATPEAMFFGLSAVSTDATNRFNALMPSLLNYGTSLGLTMSFLDMAGAVAAVRANPAAYGISNIDLPCAGFTGSAGASCDVSTFSDILHPSSRGHQLIADAAFQALGVSPVPEPQTVALLLAGLVMVGAAARRKQRAG